jgi:hypothetical protein
LKKRGTSKTPDILFSCPVGIKVPKDKKSRRKKTNIMTKHDGGDSDDDAADFEWKMICWIDSKVSSSCHPFSWFLYLLFVSLF